MAYNNFKEDIGELGTVRVFVKEEFDLEDEYFSAEKTLIDPLDIQGHPLGNNLHNTTNSPKIEEMVINKNDLRRKIADKEELHEHYRHFHFNTDDHLKKIITSQASCSNTPFSSSKMKKGHRNIIILRKKNSLKSSISTLSPKESTYSPESSSSILVPKESTDSPKRFNSILVSNEYTDSPKSSNYTLVSKESTDSSKSSNFTLVSKESTDSPKSSNFTLVSKESTDSPKSSNFTLVSKESTDSPKSTNFTLVSKESTDSPKSTNFTLVSKESTDSSECTDSTLVPKIFTDHLIVLSCVNCMLLVCNIKSYDDSMSPICLKCHRVMNYRCSICSKDCNDVNYARRHGKFCIEYWSRQQNRTTDIELTSFYGKTYAIKCMVCNATFKSSSNYLNHIDKKLCFQSILPKQVATDKVIMAKCINKGENRSIFSEKIHGKNGKINVSESMTGPKIMPKCVGSLKAGHDDSFVIIRNDPKTLLREIIKIPPKGSNDLDLKNVADWFCLQCNTASKEPFSRFRPSCEMCKARCDYRCVKCFKLFGNLLSIHRHIREQCWNPDKRLSVDGQLVDGQTFECSLCNFTSVKRAGLGSHIKQIHATYKCLKCENILQGYKEVKKHKKYGCQSGYMQDDETEKRADAESLRVNVAPMETSSPTWRSEQVIDSAPTSPGSSSSSCVIAPVEPTLASGSAPEPGGSSPPGQSASPCGHPCLICGLVFKYRPTMLRHTREVHHRVHSGTACPICKKVVRIDNLSHHMEWWHPTSK